MIQATIILTPMYTIYPYFSIVNYFNGFHIIQGVTAKIVIKIRYFIVVLLLWHRQGVTLSCAGEAAKPAPASASSSGNPTSSLSVRHFDTGLQLEFNRLPLTNQLCAFPKLIRDIRLGKLLPILLHSCHYKYLRICSIR